MTNQINNKNLLSTSSKSLWVWGLIYDRQHRLLTLTNMLLSKYVSEYFICTAKWNESNEKVKFVRSVTPGEIDGAKILNLHLCIL